MERVADIASQSEAISWECETCGWVGIVNVPLTASGSAVARRARESHNTVRADSDAPACVAPALTLR